MKRFQERVFQFFTYGCTNGHVFYLNKVGRLFAFGSNNDFKLFLSDEQDRLKPEEVKDFSYNTNKIVTGNSYSILLTLENKCYGVGYNVNGRLSVGDSQRRVKATFLKCFKNKKVQNIYGGCNHTVYIVNDSVFASGENGSGQLGVGDTDQRTVATKMKFSEKIIEIDAGFQFTLMLSAKRKLWKTGRVWREKGCNVPMLLDGFPEDEKIMKFSVGLELFFAIGNSGNVYAMGVREWSEKVNPVGSLSKLRKETSKPTLVEDLVGKDIVDLRVENAHCVFITRGGQALGVGNFSYLGCSNLANKCSRNQPYIVLKENIVQAEVGRYCTYLLSSKGDVYCAGENRDGSCGINTTENVSDEPVLNKFIKNIMKVGEHGFFNMKIWIFHPLSHLFKSDIIIKH